MSYDRKELKQYKLLGSQLIPLHIWNKQVKGKSRGKTPIHSEWTIRPYKPHEVDDWIDKGLNVGVRLGDKDFVVDLDPRNYTSDVDTPQAIAELFGYFDIEDMVHSCPTVRTGSGGYHIYFKLDVDIDCKELRTFVDDIPGADFKRKGGYVVAAGSKHPNGEYYTWVGHGRCRVLKRSELTELIKPVIDRKYTSGYGALNGTQLQALVLDKLDVDAYDTNDRWFPIMAGCHYVTGGDGIEEFLEWSTGGAGYSDDEHTIRTRWESLDDEQGEKNTAGTLIHELKQVGEDTGSIKAALQFAELDVLETDDDDSEEAEILHEAAKIAEEIDLSDVYEDSSIDVESLGEPGAALAVVEGLHEGATSDDIIRCLRVIKSADPIERSKALTKLSKRANISQSDLKKVMKELEEKIAQDLGVIIATKTLEVAFNKGKHLTSPPSGIIYRYTGTHWTEISEHFLGKIIKVGTIDKIRDKIQIKVVETGLIKQAVTLCQIETATAGDRINSVDPKPIINCKNGEVWITEDGKHKLKPHSYKSYLSSCMNVNYDPSAECPLFMDTLQGLFRDFPDTDDLIRHMGELMGYLAQPYKNIPSWWMFHGSGGDGKTTIIEVLSGVLGPAMYAASPEFLNTLGRNGDSHITDSLVGALAINVEELKAKEVLPDSCLKILSSNKKMKANPKGKKHYDFTYCGTLVITTNNWPGTRDLSQGMMRRANIVPFNRNFHKEKGEDINRARRIVNDPSEMSGVLNFMLEGLERLRSRGRFKEPESCAIAKDTWRAQSNNSIRFVNDTIKQTNNDDDLVATLADLYSAYYVPWCQDNHIEDKMMKKRNQFVNDLEQLGFKVVKGPCGLRDCKIYGGEILGASDVDNIGDLEVEAERDEFDDF